MSSIATLAEPDAPALAGAVQVLALRPSAVTGMDDAAVVRLLTEVEAVGRRVDALRVALAGEVAERSRRELGREGLAARLGCRNAVELVQRTTSRARANTRASSSGSGPPSSHRRTVRHRKSGLASP